MSKLFKASLGPLILKVNNMFDLISLNSQTIEHLNVIEKHGKEIDTINKDIKNLTQVVRSITVSNKESAFNNIMSITNELSDRERRSCNKVAMISYKFIKGFFVIVRVKYILYSLLCMCKAVTLRLL